MPPKIKGYGEIWNYAGLDNNETIALMGMSYKPVDNLSLSASLGGDFVFSDGKLKENPAIEAKIQYTPFKDLDKPIIKDTNLQFRFREIGGNEQYRLSLNTSYPINKNLSVYTAYYAALKDADKLSFKHGAWLGLSYSKNGNIFSVEGQKDFNNKSAYFSVGYKRTF